jgi:hypothetical protein
MEKTYLTETERLAVVQMPGDRGSIVEQIAGTHPGFYIAVGGSRWVYLGGFSDTSGTYSLDKPELGSEATKGGLYLTTAEATATLSGSSTTTTLSIPGGVKLVCAQLQVETAVTSAVGVSWSAAYAGGSTAAIAATQAFTKNTEVVTFFDSNAATDITSTTTNIAITPNAGTFSGGVIRAIVHYYTVVAMTDA